jgi:hypothetical protein
LDPHCIWYLIVRFLDPTAALLNFGNRISTSTIFIFSFRDDGTGGIPKELQLFDIFSQEISSIISGRKEMPPEDIVSLQVNTKTIFFYEML